LLPTTGTQALLEAFSPHIPDLWINQEFPQLRGRGRRRLFSAAQLWRVHLLALLTPVHSFNLLVQMLAEQRAWRRFAHLPNRYEVSEPWVLHEFRQRLGVAGLRRINEHLLVPLLPATAPGTFSVALIDATDLPAATCGFKKSGPANTVRNEQPWAPARLRRARAVSLSATRSTPSGCGCGATSAGCCWCRWSVGQRQPIWAKAVCSAPVWRTAGAVGSGARISSSETWVTLMRPPSERCGRAGRWPSSRGSKRICSWSLRSKRQRRRAVDTANPCSGWGMRPATNSIGLACRNTPPVAHCAGKLPLAPANLGLRPRRMRHCSDSCR
jgi:hypothetical protein